MYNTTTIPTHYHMSVAPQSFFASVLSGFILIMPFWAGIFYLVRRYDEEHRRDGDSEDESDEEDKEIDEKEERYIEEFKSLTDRPLSETNLTELLTKNVRETLTDSDDKNFDIIMTYHNESETFWYYTDNLKEVSYNTLEAVARKFVIEHDCKRLYLQKKEVEDEKKNEEETVVKPSVFAKFKKYNTGTKGGLPNFSSDVVEQTNHFRYKGKIYHYEETLKENVKENSTQLDYMAYKLLMQTN